MRKAGALIVSIVIPFVLAIVLLRMYFDLPEMDADRFTAMFVEMPDFGRQIVAEFQNMSAVLAELRTFAARINDAASDALKQFATGDILEMLTAVFNYLWQVILIVGDIWWVMFRSVYYACVMVGLILVEPVNIVVYFISALIAA